MRKKFIAVYALMAVLALGSTTLTSCVDDNESASVTAIRDAKAAQLNALAEAQKANAQATLIRANAEAAMDSALAALNQSQADRNQFQLQKDKDEYERTLEKIQLEAETALLQAKIDYADKEQMFLNLANDQIKELYRTYAYEVNELDNYKSKLNQQNLLKNQLEAQVISQDEYIAAQKAIFEANIATYEAQIAAYEAYEGKDKSELETEVNRLSTERNNALAAQGEAWKIKTEAKNAFDDVIEPMSYTSEDATLKTVLAAATLADLGYSNVFTTESYDLDEEGNYTVTSYKLTSEYAVEQARQTLESTEANAKNYLGAPAAGTTAATGLYLDLETAQKNLENAIKAENESLINQYKLEVAHYNDQIAQAKESLEEASQNLKDFEAAVASFATDSEDWKAYQAALEALKTNETVVAYMDADKALEEATEKYNDINAEYGVAVDLYNNYGVDAKDQIRQLESDIAVEKQNIVNLTNNYDNQLQQCNDEITRLTTQIEAQQAVVDLAKKNLDAAIAAQGEE